MLYSQQVKQAAGRLPVSVNYDKVHHHLIMTTYLLGIQREHSSLRIAWRGEVTVIPQESLRVWVGEHIPSRAAVQAVLSVPESHIIFKELELPILKEPELSEAIHWELHDKSSIGAESVAAWQVVEKKANTLRVMAMIMKKAEVVDALQFFADAGVELIAIEPSTISAGRVLPSAGGVSVILSLDEADVSAVFVKHRVPVFATSFPIPLTPAAVRAKHFSRDASSSLISQLKRIIAYWNAKETHVSRIIVTSEAATYSGLKSDVARAFSIPLEIGPVYATVQGAVKRVSGPVNFLPKENRDTLEKNAFGAYARMRLWQFAEINMLVLFLLGALSGFLWVSSIAYAKNITQTQRFVENHPAQKFVAHITSVNTQAKQISDLMAAQEDTGTRLAYLASVTPPKLRFTTLKMMSDTKEEWLITGAGDRADILAFYYKLKNDGKIKTITMPYSNFNSELNTLFSMTIIW